MIEEMRNKWIEHLQENNMTYCQHFKFAAYGSLLIGVHCVRLLVHAVMPCFNRKALSDIHQTAVVRRNMGQLIKSEAFRSLAEEYHHERACNRKCDRRTE